MDSIAAITSVTRWTRSARKKYRCDFSERSLADRYRAGKSLSCMRLTPVICVQVAGKPHLFSASYPSSPFSNSKGHARRSWEPHISSPTGFFDEYSFESVLPSLATTAHLRLRRLLQISMLGSNFGQTLSLQKCSAVRIEVKFAVLSKRTQAPRQNLNSSHFSTRTSCFIA
jgi:hypothetical protein